MAAPEWAPTRAHCLNAVRLGMDWRPLAGLTPEDADTEVERVLVVEVLAAAVAAHNEDAKQQER